MNTLNKRLMVLMALLIGVLPYVSAAEKFYMEPTEIAPGSSGYLWFLLDNDNEIFGLQSEIELPEGLEFATSGNGMEITLSDRAAGFNVVSNLTSPDIVKIGVLSPAGDSFSGNSGQLFMIKVNASDNFRGGDVMISDIHLTESDNKDIVIDSSSETVFVAVRSVTLSVAEWVGRVGMSTVLVASIDPADATDKTVTWTSSDGEIATVDANGKVTAVALGEATITATAGEKSATCKVTVEPTPVESVTLSATAWKGKVGESVTLTATVLPADATDKTVTWTSSDAEIATVDANGKVTAVALGEATITATANDASGIFAECKVTVMPIIVLAESLTINPESWSGNEGESFVIEATILPENTTDKMLHFESCDTEIATVDVGGLVTIVSEGTCVISVMTTDGSDLRAECYITGFSGIEQLLQEDDGRIDVYTHHGLLIKHNCKIEDLKELQPAIYIIRSGNSVKTVYLHR